MPESRHIFQMATPGKLEIQRHCTVSPPWNRILGVALGEAGAVRLTVEVALMVERVLLVINRSAATGYGEATIDRCRSILDEELGRETDIKVEVVSDHPQARKRTNAFLAASDTSALVIAGGGSGTLRAVIEGVCEDS